MADDRYSLKYTALNDGGLASGNTSLSSAVTSVASPQGMGAFAGDQLSGFGLALENVGLRIGLLTTAIESLTLKLSSQRLLPQTTGAGARSEPASEQESAGKSGGRIEPPGLLKPAIEMDSAMADLKQAARFTPREGEDMAQSTMQMASAPLVAAGGTKAVDLLRIENLAARAGIASDLPSASDRQFELLRFASDAAVTASAFKMPAMGVAEMMVGWRTAMKLDGAQAFDLADATNHLGKIPGKGTAADIGVVLQRDGAAATAAGLTPAQAAALTAALLNTGTQKADAGIALKTITTVMGKGDQASVTEQAAWKQLGLDPKAVAGGLRDQDAAPGTVMSVLAALNGQPADKRSTLATMLFSNGDEAALRMAQNLAKVNEAFWQVKDKSQYATSELGDKGSVRQSALAQSNTRQGQWNVLSARNDRLSVVTGNALSPVADSTLDSLGSLADGLSELAETSPKTTAAIVLVAAAIKPLVSALFKAIVDEMSSQVAKRVLGGVAARLPDRLGEAISEDSRNKGRTGSTANRPPETRKGPTVRVSPRGSRSTTPRRGGLTGFASMRSISPKLPGPLKSVGAVADVAEGLLVGDLRMVGAGLGAAGGGWAGASAGAAAGAALGSVVPVLGTAIGGLLGGLVGGWMGSESGAWLGEKLATPADKLPPPDQASKDLTSTQATTQQNMLTANIYINGQDQASARQLASLVMDHICGQFGPVMTTNQLAVRRDTALTDGVA
jgi:TP901 family phage tail tape measure protein